MSLGNLVIEKSWPASEAQRLKGRIAQNFSATFFDQMGSQCSLVRLTTHHISHFKFPAFVLTPQKLCAIQRQFLVVFLKDPRSLTMVWKCFFCSSTYTLVQFEINQLNFSQFSSFSGFTLRWRWLWGGSREFLSRGKLISITLGSPDLYYSCYEDNEDHEKHNDYNQDDYHIWLNQDDYNIDRDSRDYLRSCIITLGSDNILLSSVKLWAGLFNFGRILISFSLPLHNFDDFADVNQFHPNLNWPCRSETAFPEILLLYFYKFEISQIWILLHSLPPKSATKVTEFRTNVVPRLS